MPPRPVLLYDADCRFCRFAARAVVRLDRDRVLGVVPLQDEAASALLNDVPPSERLASWRLVRPDGAHVVRGAGAPELLASLRLTRPLGLALGLAPDALLDRAYSLVARHRGRLGKLVPDGEAPRRPP